MPPTVPTSLVRGHVRPAPTAHHLTAEEVTAIHDELRVAARRGHDRLRPSAATDLYAGLATVALLDHLRGAHVSVHTLTSLARHSTTAQDALRSRARHGVTRRRPRCTR